jgi:protocatechuate 3,4-dioxygenase beta subunit
MTLLGCWPSVGGFFAQGRYDERPSVSKSVGARSRGKRLKNEDQKMYKWIASIAAVSLFVGLQMTAAHAQDAATTAPAGKATVSVTVLDSNSNPVSGAKVTLMPPKARKKKAAADAGAAADPTPAPTPAGPTATGATDSDGKVSFPGIADGRYQVQVRSKTAGAGRANVTIADGQDQTVSVTLKPRAGAAAAATQPAAGQ